MNGGEHVMNTILQFIRVIPLMKIQKVHRHYF